MRAKWNQPYEERDPFFARRIRPHVVGGSPGRVARRRPAELVKPNVIVVTRTTTAGPIWAFRAWTRTSARRISINLRRTVFDSRAATFHAPQCVPSRAGVITGRYQQRFGVEDNNKGPLPLSELTIAERLKPAGYVSGWVGKCHLDIGGARRARQRASRPAA